jgi:hypothetical protein
MGTAYDKDITAKNERHGMDLDADDVDCLGEFGRTALSVLASPLGSSMGSHQTLTGGTLGLV